MRKIVIAAVAGFMPHAVAAQEAPTDPVASLTACRTITESAARLACYDQAATALQTARDKKELVVLDQTEVKKTRRSLFGFSLPRIKFLENEDEPEAQLDTTIDWARPLAGGKWTLRTAEGATWQTTEPMNDAPRTGSKVTIRRGTLGGYFLKVGGLRAVRALRVG